MPNLLSFSILFPLIGALAIAGTGASNRVLIRMIALATTALSLLCGVAVFVMFDPTIIGYQFKESLTWVEALGIQYKVGVDGINVGLILMGTIVAFAAGCGPGDDELPDAGDSGTSGTPTGADSTPPRTVEESLPPDDSLTRPERRPVRTIPPLTRPDSGRS